MSLKWERAKPAKPAESIRSVPKVAGPWSHIKREPVRTMSQAERDAFLKSRPDLQGQ